MACVNESSSFKHIFHNKGSNCVMLLLTSGLWNAAFALAPVKLGKQPL